MFQLIPNSLKQNSRECWDAAFSDLGNYYCYQVNTLQILPGDSRIYLPFSHSSPSIACLTCDPQPLDMYLSVFILI